MSISKFSTGKIFYSLAIGLMFSGNAIATSQNATKLPSQATELPAKTTRLAIDQTNPYIMIKGAAEQTFKRFASEQHAIQQNPNLLKDIVREELMPYINYKYSAFKVIGKHLKKTTDVERRAFVPVFREYLVSSYAQVFTLYDNQAV
ncbi:MAG: phospholipid transport system substrate-binding protein, partial [Colwellia sp.]